MSQHISSITKIVLHHSASHRDKTTLEEITKWHKARGFLTVGYHYVIEGDGKIRYGRPIDMVPAAQAGANSGTIAICLTGDNTKSDEEWTDYQKGVVRALVRMIRGTLGMNLPVCGHRDLSPTECPGLDVKVEFADLRV